MHILCAFFYKNSVYEEVSIKNMYIKEKSFLSLTVIKTDITTNSISTKTKLKFVRALVDVAKLGYEWLHIRIYT